MNTSETITKIAAAMHGFQIDIRDAPKQAQAHNYKYADLGSILEMVRPILHAHDLEVWQTSGGDGDAVIVTTRVVHKSGEFFADTLRMKIEPTRGMSLAQSAGSAISYCRRYMLTTALGIAQVDNDAAIPSDAVQDSRYNRSNANLDDIY
jgi:hypothetical protein